MVKLANPGGRNETDLDPQHYTVLDRTVINVHLDCERGGCERI